MIQEVNRLLEEILQGRVEYNDYPVIDKTTKLTSKTKLVDGYNHYYNPTKGNMGTFNGIRITSGVGQRDVGSSPHRGLDLDYATGTAVKPFYSGKVIFAGVQQGYGRLVIIKDNAGFTQVYAHLSKINVSVGQQVDTSTVIGQSGGSTSYDNKTVIDGAYDPHLHYEVRKPGYINKDGAIDPRIYQAS